MSVNREPKRKPDSFNDINTISDVTYNEASGAKKVMIIEPVVTKAVIATDSYDFGSYVKVTGTTYTLDCLGKAHSALSTYNIGDIVTTGGFIYRATENKISGVFNASSWIQVSSKVIGPISISAGAVVSTGRWHNTVSAIGFLVEDPSVFRK